MEMLKKFGVFFVFMFVALAVLNRIKIKVPVIKQVLGE